MNSFKPNQKRISLVILLLALTAINTKTLFGSDFATAKLLPETVIKEDVSNHADKRELADLNLISTDSTNQSTLLNSHPLPGPEPKYVFDQFTSIPNVFVPTYERYLIDIGCGGEGDMYGIGVQNDLHLYDFNNDIWNLVPLDENISNNLQRVDVDSDGTPFIVTLCGIYYPNCKNDWVKLPGSAKDIGVSVNDHIYMVGGEEVKNTEITFGQKRERVTLSQSINDPKYRGKCITTTYTNYGLWKLYCKSACNCFCERECIRFRPQSFKVVAPLGQIYRECFWFRVAGNGIAVDVLPNGNAVVARDQGGVWIYDLKDNNFFQLPIKDPNNSALVKAIDVTAASNGIIFVVSAKDDTLTTINEGGRIYRYNESDTQWDDLRIKTDLGSGLEDIFARRICASAYDQVSLVRFDKNDLKEDKQPFTSSRFKYMYE